MHKIPELKEVLEGLREKSEIAYIAHGGGKDTFDRRKVDRLTSYVLAYGGNPKYIFQRKRLRRNNETNGTT